jgi:branched-chain amino acid transport system permease protein
VSLGHAAFFGIGGYAMGILAITRRPTRRDRNGRSDRGHQVDADDLAGGDRRLGAGGAGLIGLLSLRTSGVYFIMITLAFGQMFYYFTISWAPMAARTGCRSICATAFPA